MGVSTSQYGTGMQGGVEMLFSDITCAHQFYTGLALNGEVYDFGGQLSYINQKNRVFWGATLSHIPYSYGDYGFGTDSVKLSDGTKVLADVVRMRHIRMFETMVGGMAYFPLSQTHRIETSTSFARYYYRIDVYSTYYLGNYSFQERKKEAAPPGFLLGRTDLAYVFDNSSFGIASPMKGFRARLEIDRTYGEYNFNGALIDLRKYIYQKPFCFAMRGYYYGRYSSNSNNSLYPLYIGYPWYIRGYDGSSFLNNSTLNSNYVTSNQLQGDQIAVVNFEIRLPFTGPERLNVIKSNYFFTELALFADAGIAWDSQNSPFLRWKPRNDIERIPVFSTGLSLRFNLFGMLIIEPFYAIPFQLGGLNSAYIGVNFLPGW